MTKSSSDEHEFLSRDEWEFWGAVMMLHRTVAHALDSELRRSHGLEVTEFEVLITLFNPPGPSSPRNHHRHLAPAPIPADHTPVPGFPEIGRAGGREQPGRITALGMNVPNSAIRVHAQCRNAALLPAGRELPTMRRAESRSCRPS